MVPIRWFVDYRGVLTNIQSFAVNLDWTPKSSIMSHNSERILLVYVKKEVPI